MENVFFGVLIIAFLYLSFRFIRGSLKFAIVLPIILFLLFVFLSFYIDNSFEDKVKTHIKSVESIDDL